MNWLPKQPQNNNRFGNAGAFDGTQAERALRTLGLIFLVALLIAAARCLYLEGWSVRAEAFGGSLLIAGASIFSGGLLGFLFGIPRALQQKLDPNAPGGGYSPNTNLEEISDWLTKIIVGVGLTQMTSIPPKLYELGQAVSNAIRDPTPAGASYAVGMMLFFVICGFLFAYLWARIYLPHELMDADQRLAAVAQEKINDFVDARSTGSDLGLSAKSSSADDPNKGKFGGKSSNDARELRAVVTPLENNANWYKVHLELRSRAGATPLTGPVTFYLHPTFKQSIRTIDPIDGVAILDVVAYGAFTVGVEADNSATKLELDLAELSNAPSEFRMR